MSGEVALAKRELAKEFIRSAREGDGWPVEADSSLNNRNRDLIRAYAEEGEAWLGRVNLNQDEGPDPSNMLWRWDGQLVYNFGAEFVVPRFDQQLLDLIQERHAAAYEPKTLAANIRTIFERVEAVGGTSLFWT